MEMSLNYVNVLGYIKDSYFAALILFLFGIYLIYDGLKMKRRESSILRSPLKNIVTGIGMIIFSILIVIGYFKDIPNP